MLVECVPNVSEGRDLPLLDSFAARLVPLLDRSSDANHNRTVFTFAGTPEVVLVQALSLAEAVFESLDINVHTGVHPRIGVLDVLPFVPVTGVSLEDCIALADRAAQQIWRQWQVPSFFYDATHRPLEEVRRIARGGAPPDTGCGRHPTAGAVAIGARPFLVAWNIWLQSSDLSVAKNIAKNIRTLPGVKALGFPLSSRNLVQVSINSTDYQATPLPVVFEAVSRRARQAGIDVFGSELIGLIPERAYHPGLRWLNWNDNMIFERRYSSYSVGNPSA